MAAAPTELDDDHETSTCYRHPGRETALRCNTCERPICIDCSVAAPVGIKCPECARTPRAARGAVPPQRVLTGVLAGAATAAVLGMILTVTHLPFLGIILAYVAGGVVGDVTRRASGGYRDPVLARCAAIAAAAGLLALPLLGVLQDGSLRGLDPWAVLAALAAAVAAHNRAA